MDTLIAKDYSLDTLILKDRHLNINIQGLLHGYIDIKGLSLDTLISKLVFKNIDIQCLMYGYINAILDNLCIFDLKLNNYSCDSC